MRRLPTALLASFAALVALLASGGAAASQGARTPHVDVIELVGLVDSVQVDYLEGAVRTAAEGGAEALVIQVDSGAGVAGRSDIDALLFRVCLLYTF
jgi:membrane-bound ClpP family serine protease